MEHKKILTLTRLSLFIAIMIVMAATPLGHIQMPFVKATTMHVPVIVGAVFFGPKFGAVLGFVFGCTSVVTSTLAPNVTSFAFSPFLPVPGTASGSPCALIIAFVPRILVGVVAGIVYLALSKKLTPLPAALAASLTGTVTNVALVLSGIYIFFSPEYAAASGILQEELLALLLGVVALNGTGETLIAMVVCSTVVLTVSKARQRA